jgi:hypothetical protein|tara:strand:- start:4085 stop:4684 length:600 start_codon:yes stop_codon:yes gene_type:complete
MAGKSKIVRGALSSLEEFLARNAERNPMPKMKFAVKKMKPNPFMEEYSEFENDRILLQGGFPDLNVPMWAQRAQKDVARLIYDVWDIDLYKKLGLSPDTANQAKVGKATLNVKINPETGRLSEKIDSIVNLQLEPQFQGADVGQKIINSLLANTDDGLKLHDVRPTLKKLRKEGGGEEESRETIFIRKPQGALKDLVDE